MKLNLGCGFNKMPAAEGWVNIDAWYGCEPDVELNLEQKGWRIEPSGYIEESSVDEVLFNHSLEHMGATLDGFKTIMQELYRVCRDGAEITIRVPHFRHDDYWADPSHVRVITIPMMHLFSKKACAHFREQKAANTPFADMWDVDFEVVSTNYGLDERFGHWVGDPGLQRMILTQNNVVKEITIVLRAVKPKEQPAP